MSVSVESSRSVAAGLLDSAGMHYIYSAAHDSGDREYWGYGDGTDSLADHSATITPLGGGRWGVSVIGQRKSSDG